MSDIVERIRSLRYVHVPVASQLFEEAASEIERLRLTGAEREAVEYAELITRCETHPVCEKHAATLRDLLERLK